MRHFAHLFLVICVQKVCVFPHGLKGAVFSWSRVHYFVAAVQTAAALQENSKTVQLGSTPRPSLRDRL